MIDATKILNDLRDIYNLSDDEVKMLTLMAEHNLLHLLSEEYINMNKEAMQQFRLALEYHPNSEEPDRPYRLRNTDKTDLMFLIGKIAQKVPNEYAGRIIIDETTKEAYRVLKTNIEAMGYKFDENLFVNMIIEYYNDDTDEYKKNLNRLLHENGIALYLKALSNKDKSSDLLL